MHKLKHLGSDTQALDMREEATHPPEVRPYTETLPRNIVRLDITIEASVHWKRDVSMLLDGLAKTRSQTSMSLKDVRIVGPLRYLLTVK
jgi:hypothetical protein